MAEVTQNFIADVAIPSSKYDDLGRKKFAVNIAERIYCFDGKESFVIGLYGAWGSGKTSIINMVAEYLSLKENAPLIIRFEPWYFSGQNQLLQQFFKILSYHLKNDFEKTAGKGQELAKKVGESIQKWGNVLSPIKYALPLFIPNPAIETSTALLKGGIEYLTGLEDESSFDPLEKKIEISNELSSFTRKILVVIDDIDRLTQQEMLQVFQLVKGLANFPNIIYLLSFDPRVVGTNISKVYGNDTYLEKIVQVPFHVPIISRKHLTNYLYAKINETIGVRDEKLFPSDYWNEVYFHYGLERYFENLRDINRFLNIFQLEYSLLKKEVNHVDLILLSAIKAKDSKLLQFIEKFEYIFVEKGMDNFIFLQKMRNEKGYKKHLKQLYESHRKEFKDIEVIEVVLKHIFPYFEEIFDEKTHAQKSFDALKRCRRAAHPEIFPLFFQLELNEDSISFTSIQSLINLQHSPQEFCDALRSYIDTGKGADLFYELRLHIRDFINIDKEALIKNLIPIADKIDSKCERETLMLTTDGQMQIFIKHLLDKKSSNEIINFLYRIYEGDLQGINLPLALLLDYGEEFKFYDREGNRNVEAFETSAFGNDFKSLEQKVFKKIAQSANEGALQKHLSFAYILFRWYKYDAYAVEAFINKLILTQLGVIDFLTGMLSYQVSSDGKVPYLQNFGHLLDKTKLKPLVEEIKQDQALFESLADDSKTAIETFLSSLNN